MCDKHFLIHNISSSSNVFFKNNFLTFSLVSQLLSPTDDMKNSKNEH